MINKEFGDALRCVRVSAGLKQEEAAKLLFLARSTYNHYEAGKRIPNIDILIRISALFNMNPLELLMPLIPKELLEKYPHYNKILLAYSQLSCPEAIKFITLFLKLSDEEKSSILKTMHLFIKAHE